MWIKISASTAVQFGKVPVMTPILPLNRTHSDASLTTTILAVFEVEEHDKVDLNHLFPQSPNINGSSLASSYIEPGPDTEFLVLNYHRFRQSRQITYSTPGGWMVLLLLSIVWKQTVLCNTILTADCTMQYNTDCRLCYVIQYWLQTVLCNTILTADCTM